MFAWDFRVLQGKIRKLRCFPENTHSSLQASKGGTCLGGCSVSGSWKAVGLPSFFIKGNNVELPVLLCPWEWKVPIPETFQFDSE